MESKITNNLMTQEFSFPATDDPNLQYKLYQKREFYYHSSQPPPTIDDYNDLKDHRDNICAKNFTLHEYQSLIGNFINPNTPYKGLVLFYGVGSGKTATAINVAEQFKPLITKYNTKIIILVSGTLIKEMWKNELLSSTGETYLKYQDKSIYIDEAEKTKNKKNALIQAMQYYKFMSYKSFYKHVLGEKISDKQEGNKAIYRKDDHGDFERDISIDRIYNLNNTLLIVDEAHNLTGNSYGDALKLIIKNSVNLKLLLLSATPMKNLGSDIIPLINFLRPLNSQIEVNKVFDNNSGHTMGFKQGGLDYLKNMMRGYISHVKGANPITFAIRNDKGIKPEGLLFTKVTRCFMMQFQKNTYDKALIDNKEDTLDRKSEAVANFVFPGLSSDKKKLIGYYSGEGLNLVKNQLKINSELINKKISMMLFNNENEKDLIYVTEDGRSISGKILKTPYLKYFSIKFYKTIKKLSRLVSGKKGAKTAFIYSNLVKVGISLFSEILIQNGYLEFQDDFSNYQISSDTICHFCGKTHAEHKNIQISRTNGIDSDIDTTNYDNINENTEIKISDSSSEYKKTNITEHIFRPATFISITGKSNEESIEALPEEKKRILDTYFNNLENKDGRYIKFILGSRVMNEGISLKNVGEVHILDAYFNLGRVDQVVGRGIRWCSHYKIMSQENPYPLVNVYKYVVSLKNELSTEEELYKKAELKYLLIKKIERAMKEVAIDCPLNTHNNMFKQEIDIYKNCKENDPINPCPAICDYTKCDYKCDDEKLNAEFYDPNRGIYKKILKNKLDYSTFTHELARNEINYAKEKIKEMYITSYLYTLDNILEYVKQSYDDSKKELFDEFFIYKALDELIPITENDFNNYKDTIIDKYNRTGYLIYVSNYYIYQPYDEIEAVPMYYRTNINKNINQSLSLYNYLKKNPIYKKFKENSEKNKNNVKQNEKQIIYDFESAMEFYDSREENFIVGIIDKEISRRKNKSIDEIKDVFKIREKRAKILEKKRATGLPSFYGSVCVSSKSKKYLEKIMEKLGATIKKKTRLDICQSIENKLLFLEKYNTENKTYVILPTNNPKFPFPYNLKARVANRTEKIKKEIGSKIEIDIKKIKKDKYPQKDEIGMPSYLMQIKNDKSIKEYEDFLKNLGFSYSNNKWNLLLE
jgi:superfamily II DNA or RNA helicase